MYYQPWSEMIRNVPWTFHISPLISQCDSHMHGVIKIFLETTYIFSQFIYSGTFRKFKIIWVKTIQIYLLYSDRFEIEIEPLFASIALYDVKERKKVRKQKITHRCGHAYCSWVFGFMFLHFTSIQQKHIRFESKWSLIQPLLLPFQPLKEWSGDVSHLCSLRNL